MGGINFEEEGGEGGGEGDGRRRRDRVMEPTPGAFAGWKGPHHAGRRASDVSLTGRMLQGSWSLLVFAGLLRAKRDRCPVLALHRVRPTLCGQAREPALAVFAAANGGGGGGVVGEGGVMVPSQVF